MKKILFFGAIALMLSVNTFAGVEDNNECPNRCGSTSAKCCTTKAGSTYFGGVM
jgi:hypothetical protein